MALVGWVLVPEHPAYHSTETPFLRVSTPCISSLYKHQGTTMPFRCWNDALLVLLLLQGLHYTHCALMSSM